ncbi:cytochrome P450 [Streptomyces sp. NPDC001137]|uniref:cytochrome P450 n=1 Tax=Streptomyces sp. NPDC001137 TaxID=3154378 RepID=UPI0033231DF3
MTRCLEELGAADRPADLHRLVCRPLPVRVMGLMLGVPEADSGRFAAWADAWTSIADPDAARAGQAALLEYFASLVEQRSGDLGPDIISDLIRHGSTAEQVTTREMVALSATLLFAGYETTVAALDKAMLLLLSHPEAYRSLGRDSATRASAIEETLRFANVLPAEEENRHLGIVRYAHDDIAIADGHGAIIRKGDLVMIQKLKCNQDTVEFGSPDVFDISRCPNRHLTFGHGRRYCPGAPLARLEMEELFERLPAHFPGLRLAVDMSDIRRVPKRLTPQVESLPVTW